MIKLIVDSGCDLPEELLSKYDIGIIPLHVIVDGVDRKDNGTIDSKEMYEEMEKGAVVSTSQVNHADFFEYFDTCSDDNEYIYIALSSILSSTYQSAVFVQNELKESRKNFKLHIVDSKSATMCNALMCMKALEMIEAGEKVIDIVDKLNSMVNSLEVIGAVDTLKYLERGGRIGKASAVIGNILNIKPLIRVKASIIENFDKARGDKQKIKKMIDYIISRVGEENISSTIFGVSHADNDLQADIVIEKLNLLGAKYVYKAQLTAVLGAHTGKGIITVSFEVK